MKKHLIVAGVVLFAFPAQVHGAESGWVKVGKFLGGIVASVAIHEGSHYAVAKAQGIDITFNGLQWQADEYSTTLQLAGLIGNAVSSEIVLWAVPAEERGAFYNGLLLANSYEEITYPTLRYNKLDYGNLRTSETTKRNFAVLFVSHGSYTLYRMHRDRPNPELSFNGDVRNPGMHLAYRF